ncbi:MAG: AAC(3) family N-acetyltransferase [Bellilinea sp.]
MLSYRELTSGFRNLGLDPGRPVLVHSSLRAFGDLRGRAAVLLGALTSVFPRVMAPTHTYATMVIPEEGPDHNGMEYGTGQMLNALAEIYYADMPADRMMGVLPELLRNHPLAKRSMHPILSLAGIGVDEILAAQKIKDPVAPLHDLYEAEGYVLLMGVGHSVNTTLHFAEKLAGRRTFVRWALTSDGAVECPGYPGCSMGFDKAAPYLADITRSVQIGTALVRALPVREMVITAATLVREDPLALLCDDLACERCAAVREGVGNTGV